MMRIVLYFLAIAACIVSSLNVEASVRRDSLDANARVIIAHHEKNRSDQDFIHECTKYSAQLYLSLTDPNSDYNKGNPSNQDDFELTIILCLNSKLIYQYAIDNKKSIGEEKLTSCRKLSLAAMSWAKERYPALAQSLVDSFPDYRRSFQEHPQLMLRSL